MKLVTVVGARPQFVKASVLRRAFKAIDGVDEILLHTGQHYDSKMSDIFFDELEIAPPEITHPTPTGGHGAATGKMLEAIEQSLIEEAPDFVLVYGDTNSTLAGALAAAKLHIPIVHVEAGLRSFDRRMPEEVNRVLTDHVSDLLFAPTRTAATNLATEGITKNVHNVGDIMYDATRFALEKCGRKTNVAGIDLEGANLALITIHRAENTDDDQRLQALIDYINLHGEAYDLVMPLHPRTRKSLERAGISLGKITPIEPVGYFDFQTLLASSRLIFTDSGGVQKEAFFARVPCVTLRDNTEWTELIESGWNRLWICEDFKPRRDLNEYGNGDTGDRIVNRILSHFA